MSGIYGFSYLHSEVSEALLDDTIGALHYWNRIYGREAHGQMLLGTSGIGCHLEHFSEEFPHASPVLPFRSGHAVVDALIFNRRELLEKLNMDASGASLSDEELLLRWIDARGFEALAAVNGDFAGAIFDADSGAWTLFRDHMGVRPLYVYTDEKHFGFSTDLRALAAMPEADVSIDEKDFFIRASGTNPLSLQRTGFARIRCALPGAVTRIIPGAEGYRCEEQVYWTPRRKKIRRSTVEDYRRELRELITDAVNRRCDAIPGLLGGELSGGLDSTVIDILVCRHGREAKFFSWSWDTDTIPLNEGEDERKTIDEICRREHTECHYMNARETVSLQDAGEALLPPYIASQTLGFGSAWLHSQGARVVFSGHGGDEGVSHRGQRYELYCYGEYLTYFRYYWLDLKGKPLRLLRAVRAGLKDVSHNRRRSKESPAMVPGHLDVFAPTFRERMLREFRPQPFTFNFVPHLFVQQGGTRPRMDNAAYQGAVHGMRYLFPYVDYRVMDYALSIPRRLFVGHRNTRVLFRDAFRDLLPESLYARNYKDQASTRHLSADTEQDLHQQIVSSLLGKLDPDNWKEYLDLHTLNQLLLSSEGKAGGIGSVDGLLAYIGQCIMIQDVQKNAKRWREFDEQHKTV